MKKFYVFVYVIFVTSYINASDFIYNQDLIDVGYLYKYERKGTQEKSDIVYIYFPKENSMEMILIEPELSFPTLMVSKFAWNYLMTESIMWEYMGRQDQIAPGNVIKFLSQVSFDNKKIECYQEILDEKGLIKKERTKISIVYIPTYFYYFDDGLSLVWALRFFNQGIKKHEVVIVMGGNFNVKASVTYVGDELVELSYGRELCQKYEVSGNGVLAAIFGKKAFVWLSKEKPYYMLRYRNENKRDIGFDFIDYRIVYRKSLSLRDWESIKENFRKNGSCFSLDKVD